MSTAIFHAVAFHAIRRSMLVISAFHNESPPLKSGGDSSRLWATAAECADVDAAAAAADAAAAAAMLC